MIETCKEYLLYAWNPDRICVFVFNEDNICISTLDRTSREYLGRDLDYVIGAMYSVMRYRDGTEKLDNSSNGYPSIETIHPER